MAGRSGKLMVQVTTIFFIILPMFVRSFGGMLLNLNGGGDRTRTCIAFRPAVFKTAALPLCDPSARGLDEYNACAE
jgi:hypothetical protein